MIGKGRYQLKRSVSQVGIALILIVGFVACNSTKKKPDSKVAVGLETPGKNISLFNGKDLNGWHTYQRPPEPTSEVKGLKKRNGEYVEPIGLDKDPLNVFTVVNEDGEPAIRISGEVFGALITEKEFENYHLSLEFKWGGKKFPPRQDRKRDSGVLYHSIGPEGVAGGSWMRSVELQVQEGDVGDLWCVDSTTAKVKVVQLENKKYRYDDQGKFHIIDMREDRYCQKSDDHEKENGEWNRIDIYVYGQESIHVVNGRTNMHLKKIGQIINGKTEPLTKGKIQIQSEGAEVFYRKITIESIKRIPVMDSNQ